MIKLIVMTVRLTTGFSSPSPPNCPLRPPPLSTMSTENVKNVSLTPPRVRHLMIGSLDLDVWSGAAHIALLMTRIVMEVIAGYQMGGAMQCPRHNNKSYLDNVTLGLHLYTLPAS